MQLQETKEGDVLILTLEGHLDTAAAPQFEERLLKLIAGGESRVLVDCAKLDYVNSAGLKVFLLAAKQLDAAGGKLVLCGLTPSVQSIFDMIGFSKIMNLALDQTAGLRMFQENGAGA